MRPLLLLFAAMLATVPAAAQTGEPSPPASTQDAPTLDLPVSVERIRELLTRTPADSVLRGLDRQPDYKITVEERRQLKDILESLDVKTGPPPAGGLYGYETQQQVWNTRNSPLVRPYAAFTSGELVQVSITSILTEILARFLTNGVKDLSRAHAETLAHDEAQRAIAEYCEGRPDRTLIELCALPSPH